MAKLSNIGLSDAEVASLAPELDTILKLVEQLETVKTDEVEPTDQVTGLVDVFRPDEVRPGNVSRDDLLKNAPDQQDGYIKVHRVRE